MKILYINAVCGVGSTGRLVIQLMNLSKSEGYVAEVLCSTIEPIVGVEPQEAISVGSKASYYLHNLLSRIDGREGLHSTFVTMKAIKCVERYNPDIVHIHNLHGHWINYKCLFNCLSKLGVRVIWTLHDCWSFTGHCTHFITANCDKWKSSCFECPLIREYPQSYRDNSKTMYRIKKDIFTSIEDMTLVTPSQWLANNVKQSYLNKYPLYVINNGIDLSVFHPTNSNFRERNGLSDNSFILLGVSFSWSYKKGLDVFIELSNRLDNNYIIVLVGLDEKISKSLPSNVISISRTNNQRELVEIYSSADLFVNPTREENFPTVNIESLACGTPVLTFDTGGSPEIIDESCGSVVGYNDIDSLEKEIVRIHNERPFSEKACLLRAKQFDVQDKLNSYIDLYKKL